MLPEPLSLTIQAEKLRLSVLTARDVIITERRLRGFVAVLLGAAVFADGVLDPNLRVSSVANVIPLTQATAGLALFGVGLFSLLSSPPESSLWRTLQRMEQLRKDSPEIYLAEAEATFEAAVQKAVFQRRLTGVLMGTGALALTALALATPQENPDDVRRVKIGLLPNAVALGIGLVYLFAYQAPIERAWGAYMNDKNLGRSYISLAPLLGISPTSFFAGFALSF